MIYEDLILNEKIFSILTNAWKQSRLPHALIFHGANGVGKEAHAIEFSALLNCKNIVNNRACGECSQCLRIKSFQHGNVKLISPMPASSKSTSIEAGSIHSLSSPQLKTYQQALEEKGKDPYYKIGLKASTIPIAIVRELRKDLYMSSIESGWRIVMIFEAEKLCTGTQASANALLKILEEPPEKTLFMLVTSSPNQLLDTIKSRSQSFYFSSPTDRQIETILINRGLESKRCRIISKMCQGNISLAMNLNNHYDSIPKDIKIIFESFFNDDPVFIQQFQNRLQDLNRIGNKELFDNFFQLQIQLVRDIILLKQDKDSLHIVFSHLKEKYIEVIDDNKNADFHSILEAIDDAYRMNLGNVNLSLNSISLIFDIQSCLEGKVYQSIE